MKMSGDFDLPDDLADSVDVIYVDDEEIDNLETDQLELNNEEADVDLPEDKSLVTFKEHTRSVFAVRLNNAGNLAVTGAEDDLAYVWEVKTGSVVLECTGHKDSVTAVGFSHDDKYVVTGDMSGQIQVWDVAEKKLIWCYEGDELEWLLWHRSAHVLFCGVHTGEIYMWQIPDGKCKVFAGYGAKCVCGELLPNNIHLIAGYQDNCLRIWDLKTGSVLMQTNAEGGGALHGLSMSADSKLVATCGLNAVTHVYKLADLKMVAALQADGEEIEVVAFCPELDLPIIVTGSLNGNVCFWDISRQTLRHKISIGEAITNLIWGANAILFVASVDGCIYAYNGRNGTLVSTFTGHTSAVLDLCISKDNKLLLSTSDDETAKVFQVL